MPPVSLKDLVSVPFGLGQGETPIDLEHTLLLATPICSKHNHLWLSEVSLWSKKTRVGLDQTETIIFPNNTLGNAPVFVKGIFTIECLRCLSSVGTQIVTQTLANRSRRNNRVITPKLSSYYPSNGELCKIKICVLDRRTQPAVFLSGKAEFYLKSVI